jgi:uncharacterized membrane protein
METNITTKVADRQTWLDPIAGMLQSIVKAAYRLDRTGLVQDALQGKWLGHSVHVAITDVPIGAWTTAVLLDGIESAAGREDLAAGADAAIGIGLVGAVASAVTGLTDYQHVEGTARRIGIVHGLLNITSAGIFAGSLVARKRGSRGAGKALSLVGFSIAMVSAKLGGDMVYKHGIAVDAQGQAPFADKRALAG